MANVLWIKNPAVSGTPAAADILDLGFSIPTKATTGTTIIITDNQQGFIEELMGSRDLRELLEETSTAIDGSTEGYLQISADGTNFYGGSIGGDTADTARAILASALRRLDQGNGFDSPTTDATGKLDAVLKLGTAGFNVAGAGVTVTSILDEDAMGSNSAVALASQQSIKAYVDSQVSAIDLDGYGALGSATLHQTQDVFIFSDNGTEKKITFSNLEDSIFGNISGDATIAAGGALTIAATAVEGSMLNDNIISGQGALGSAAMAQADLLLFDDGPGTVKKITFSNFEDSIFGNLSGAIAVAAGGAVTIPNDYIDSAHYAAGSIDNEHLADDAVGADELAANAVLEANILNDAVTLAKMAHGTDANFIIYSGSGAPASVAMSGDATMANDGAVTLAANSVSQAQLDNDAVGAAELAADAVVNASVASGADIAANKIDFNVDMGGGWTFGNQANDLLTVSGSLTVTGDLIVSGDTVSVNVATLNVEDPLISMASGNNGADAVDIGFYGLYDPNGTDQYSGLFRDANDSGKWKLFKDLQAAPTTVVNTSGTGYAVATLVANLEGNATGSSGTCTGLAGSATVLATARNIAGVSFNGSANINIAPTDLTGVNSTAAELNLLDGSVANAVHKIWASGNNIHYNAADTGGHEWAINGWDGAALTTTEFNINCSNGYFVDGSQVINTDTLGSTVLASSLTSVGTIASGSWAATDVAIAHGGTGASTAAAALVNLGLGATAAELNIMDGSATTQATVTLAKTDGVVISDGDDMKQCLVSDIGVYIASAGKGLTVDSTSGLVKVNAYSKCINLEFTNNIPKPTAAAGNLLALKIGGLSSNTLPLAALNGGKAVGMMAVWDTELAENEDYDFVLQKSANGGQSWTDCAKVAIEGDDSGEQFIAGDDQDDFSGSAPFSAGNLLRCIALRKGSGTGGAADDPTVQSSWDNVRVSVYIAYASRPE